MPYLLPEKPKPGATPRVAKPGIPPQLGKPEFPGGGRSRKLPEAPPSLPPRRRTPPKPSPTKGGGTIGIPERGMRPRRPIPQRRPSLGGQGRFFLD